MAVCSIKVPNHEILVGCCGYSLFHFRQDGSIGEFIFSSDDPGYLIGEFKKSGKSKGFVKQAGGKHKIIIESP